MKNDKYKTIGTAKTLGELASLINDAIEVAGHDAEWSAWDDGSILIYSASWKDDQETLPIHGWYRIKAEKW